MKLKATEEDVRTWCEIAPRCAGVLLEHSKSRWEEYYSNLQWSDDLKTCWIVEDKKLPVEEVYAIFKKHDLAYCPPQPTHDDPLLTIGFVSGRTRGSDYFAIQRFSQPIETVEQVDLVLKWFGIDQGKENHLAPQPEEPVKKPSILDLGRGLI